MSALLKEISDVSTRLAELQAERGEREKSANAHEAASRADRLAMSDLKQQIQELTTVLNRKRVVAAVETEHEAAQKARTEADKINADAAETLKAVKAQQAELAALIKDAKKKKAE